MYLGIYAHHFYSKLTWNFPSEIFVEMSKYRWIGNFIRRQDLYSLETLDYMAQYPLLYYVVFEVSNKPVPIGEYLDLGELIDLSNECFSCGYPTCCGLINQYVTKYEMSRFDYDVAYWVGDIGILRQKNGSCVYYSANKCLVQENKPLWCRMYVCDFMYQRVRSRMALRI